MKRLDLTKLGPFGRLTAVRAVGKDDTGRVKWFCKCTCGGSIVVTAHKLRMSRYPGEGVRSCGCLRRENAAKQLCKSRTKDKTEAEKETPRAHG